MNEHKSGIEMAVDAAGGQRALSRLTGLSASFINKMHTRRIAAPSQCQLLHDKTGVPLELLNPQVYRPINSPENIPNSPVQS